VLVFLHKGIKCNAQNVSQKIQNCSRSVRATFMQGGEAGTFSGKGYFSACQVLVDVVSGYPVKANTEGHVTISFWCYRLMSNYFPGLMY
jgi:hypothetical protein